jgi:hypothetical protein
MRLVASLCCEDEGLSVKVQVCISSFLSTDSFLRLKPPFFICVVFAIFVV